VLPVGRQRHGEVFAAAHLFAPPGRDHVRVPPPDYRFNSLFFNMLHDIHRSSEILARRLQ